MEEQMQNQLDAYMSAEELDRLFDRFTAWFNRSDYSSKYVAIVDSSTFNGHVLMSGSATVDALWVAFQSGEQNA